MSERSAMSPFRLLIGLTIIFIGVTLFGTNMGWWPMVVLDKLWLLWPIVLIVIGLNLLFHDEIVVSIITITLIGLGLLALTRVSNLQVGHWPFGQTFDIQHYMRYLPR
jgi:hypothetical protein